MLFLVLLSSSLYSQNNPFYIQNVQEKEREAVNGSASAADDLSFFYAFSENIPHEQKKEMVTYWALIGAENDTTGHCQYNYYELEVSDAYQTEEKERALYWLFTSANLGYNSAKEAISLENLENEYNTFFVLDSDYPIKDLQESDLPYYKNEALRGSGVAAKVIAYGFVGSIIF